MHTRRGPLPIPLETIHSEESWPPTPVATRSWRCRLERVAVGLLLISALSTVLGIAYTSDGLSNVDDMPTPLSAATRPLRMVRRALLHDDDEVQLLGNASLCADKHSDCSGWAAAGECTANARYMEAECARSCGKCDANSSVLKWDRYCDDKSSFCGQWAAVGECDSNPSYMRANCPVTCHLCQSRKCHDHDRTLCNLEAEAGQCRSSPERMYAECRWACKWCSMDTSKRCRRSADLRPAARKGSVEYMFKRASDPMHAHLTPRVHSRDPWVVSFDTFLSDEEAERIIRVGGKGWMRSQAGDGVQAVRTSSTAWCDHYHCGSDPVLASIRKRIANLTLVPERNAEHLQVLKYETGQFYRTHHDQNSPTTSAWGPRMYTFFMYLNDAPGGGETRFPQLNISVKPKRGRALLWTSVLDSDPNERDFRTEHEAVVVTAGQKFAANYWLHMWDFQEANDKGCGNSEVFGNW